VPTSSFSVICSFCLSLLAARPIINPLLSGLTLLKGNHKIFVENAWFYVNIMIFLLQQMWKISNRFAFDIWDLNVSHENFQLILNNAFSIGLR
jgi:hypothetical protein